MKHFPVSHHLDVKRRAFKSGLLVVNLYLAVSSSSSLRPKWTTIILWMAPGQKPQRLFFLSVAKPLDFDEDILPGSRFEKRWMLLVDAVGCIIFYYIVSDWIRLLYHVWFIKCI